MVGVAVIGAAVTVVDSWLVMTGTTGFQLAGFVSAIGFALIGSWLVAAIAIGPLGATLSPLEARIGLAAGALMLVGLLGIAGVAMRIDSASATPWWLWLTESAGSERTSCIRRGVPDGGSLRLTLVHRPPHPSRHVDRSLLRRAERAGA